MISKEETIKQLQEIVDENKNPLLVKVHIGLLIHALKYLKEEDEKKQ